tara:strand:+ start:994 stop:1248 length:255 start_codon:yes stop_codon:yes gene_type:complete
VEHLGDVVPWQTVPGRHSRSEDAHVQLDLHDSGGSGGGDDGDGNDEGIPAIFEKMETVRSTQRKSSKMQNSYCLHTTQNSNYLA